MRGNHSVANGYMLYLRSIPAHAGQPLLYYFTIEADGVYPRACGATRKVAVSHINDCGLSPRMRGNPSRRRYRLEGAGSIPAHAGQPYACHYSHPPLQVYPRACGATFPIPELADDTTGLSPRMRGNRDYAHSRLAWLGSIPAHAGQPHNNPP